ncbi:50S ribosomal protein L30 [Desulfonatronospira sp.]|uniref:50S ribosomal protein L30 n=1 Tax=Desulfonatronospira sp. TaxID=1962951 RepID=UPI0025BC668E|nr:50S ribosomal protein L30 [Desulfonatronospira sp.]
MKIKLKKSFIGLKPVQKKTLKALGFKRPNQVLEVQDNPSIKGMIKKVQSFVEVVT